MVRTNHQVFNFFGIDLAPSDDPLSIKFKSALARKIDSKGTHIRNPYDALTEVLRDFFDAGIFQKSGEMDVPTWLAATPLPDDIPNLTPDLFNQFVDQGGCRRYAAEVEDFLAQQIPKGIPFMVSVDHSMTGGSVKALSKRFGAENLTVLVIDSHFDGIGFSERKNLFDWSTAGAAGGAGELRPLTDVCENYNCANWLHYLLAEKTVMPENLIVLGVSDYPSDEMKTEPGVEKYTLAYLEYEKRGVSIIPKDRIQEKGVNGAVRPILENIKTDYLYVSLDVDIGSLNAVHAARFMNVVGLGQTEINEIAHLLNHKLLGDVQLAGGDVNGMETFLLGRRFPNGITDRTLAVVDGFIRILIR